MNVLRTFEEFIKENIVQHHSVDARRSEFLKNEAENRKLFLKDMITKIKISESNANYFVETSYDIMIELIRAKMCLDGFKASGNHAHEAEVSYLRILNFNKQEVENADELRYYRNGIHYYGKKIDKAYAETALKFLEEIYPKLIRILNQK